MDTTQILLEDIERFLVAAGMEPTTFGQKAVRDWKLVERLRGGGSVTLRNADRLRAFMAAYRAESAKHGRAA
jgi:hypothetical protein